MPSSLYASPLDDRLLAEALRVLEEDGRTPITDDVNATIAGRQAKGGVEAQIIARARAAKVAPELKRGLARVAGVARLIVGALLTLLLFVGAGAAQASLGLGADSHVNFFHALAALLGVQTVILTIWTVLMLWHPSGLKSISIGGALRWIVDWIMRRASKSRTQLAAIEAAARVHANPRVAKWTLSSLSHSAWCAFNTGCIAALLILLSTRHYTFVWETTILSSSTYAPVVEAIGALPKQVGFNVPTLAQVAQSEWTGVPNPAMESDAELSHAWSGLLLGSIILYGALPRFTLLFFCLWRLRIARRRYHLDLNRAGFAILADRLSPREQSLGVIDADHGEGSVASPTAQRMASRPAGAPAIVGLELERPRTWPPRPDGLALDDLGIINDRPDLHRVVAQLRPAKDEPAALVITCSLTSTPDRGLGSIIAQLRGAVSRPVYVLLTGGQALRERGDSAALGRRIDDWRKLAAQAGISSEDVLELDLDHATHASLARLAIMLRDTLEPGVPAASAEPIGEPARRIDRAFSEIVHHVDSWQGAPGTRQQLALHQDIMRLYGDAPSKWKSLFTTPPTLSELKTDAMHVMRKNADRAVQMLPPQLRIRPKWAIAGASVGAIGCIAASALAAPAIIGALPLWSAIGATVAAAASTVTRRLNPADDHKAEDEEAELLRRDAVGNAVRAAALAALLLELQRRSEQTISHILDRVLSETADAEDDRAIESAEAARTWLEALRHRYDVALAEEASS